MRLNKLPKVSPEEILCRLQYLRARATHSCAFCEGEAKVFTSPDFQTEYKISAICEDCQIALGIADYSLNTKAA
jgi:hypothetical protein